MDKKSLRLMQLVVLEVGATAFLVTAVATGVVYTRGAEADLTTWLPIAATINGFILASIGAGPKAGKWPRRFLASVPAIGTTAMIWYGIAYIGRHLFYWDAIQTVIFAQLGSMLAVMLFAVRQMGEGVSEEEKDEAQKTRDSEQQAILERLRRLEDLNNAQRDQRRKKNKRR
jgi:hypothetical protein